MGTALARGWRRIGRALALGALVLSVPQTGAIVAGAVGASTLIAPSTAQAQTAQAQTAQAQTAQAQTAEAPTLPADAYRDAATRRRVQVDVEYLDPTSALDLETAAPTRRDTSADRSTLDPETTRTLILIICGAIVLGVIFAIARHGLGLSAAFGRRPDSGRRDRAAPAEESDLAAQLAAAGDMSLAEIDALADRTEALRRLLLQGLKSAADQNRMVLRRSQTARDVLHATPRDWPHRDRLNRLVREAELVLFAGRPLGEDTFAACLDAARPFFGGRA